MVLSLLILSLKILKSLTGEVIEFNLSRYIITKKNIYYRLKIILEIKNLMRQNFLNYLMNLGIEIADVDIAYFLSGGIDSTSIIES